MIEGGGSRPPAGQARVDRSNSFIERVVGPNAGPPQRVVVSDGVPLAGPAATPYHPKPVGYWRTTEDVNLRSGPGVEHERLGTLPAGTLLQTSPDLSAEADWVPVTTPDGRTGFVSGDYADPVAAADRAAAGREFDALRAASAIYINQLDAEAEVGLPVGNANCGPTSLAMALRQQGLGLPAIEGVADGGTAGDEVQQARYAMYREIDPARDGIVSNDDGSVSYSNDENSTYTGWSGMQAAVTAAGGEAVPLRDADEIHAAVAAGRSVIVSGSFVDLDASGQPTDVERDLWLTGSERHGATRHIVVITGLTADGGYVVNDPINGARAPVVVSADELATFMNGNWGAMSVGRRELSMAEARRLVS